MADEIIETPGKIWDMYGEFLSDPGMETSVAWIPQEPVKDPLKVSRYLIERAVYSRGELIILGEDDAGSRSYSRLFARVTKEEWEAVGLAYERCRPASSVLCPS